VDTIGIYRPSRGQFQLRNTNTEGPSEASFFLGNVGDVGIAGDWNGDGLDSTGVFRPSNGVIFLKDNNETGFADYALNYGLPSDKPVMGDWDNDGIDTIGIYRNGTFYLRNENTNGFATIVFGLGIPGDIPIAGNWDGMPSEDLPPIIPPTTRVLPATTTQYLSSVSGDGTVFTFSQGTPELSELSPGEIIVGDATPAAPYGFLRKIVSVSNNGGQVDVQTAPATIDEAVQQGEVSVSQVLMPSNLVQPTLAEGVQVVNAPSAVFNTIQIQLNNVVLYDQDGNANTTNDQINANGRVSLVPSVDFRLKVQNFQLKELYFTMTASQTAQLKIGSKVAVTVKAEPPPLANIPMGPLFLTIGTFPVTVYPVLTVVVGIDGSVSASVSTGVTQTLSQTAGLSYANGNWSPIQRFSNQFQYDPLTSSSALSFKAYIGAKLKILLYGAVGPDIALNTYLKLEAPLPQPSLWKLYGGLEVPVGISIDIFSHVIASYSAVVINYQRLLAQADVPTPSFTDQFDNPPLNAGWTWVDPLGDSSYSLTANPGSLRLSTPDHGHDLYMNFDAPRLVRTASGNFDIKTKVTINPQYNYQGAGLLIWQDVDNYIRLERTLVSGVDLWYRVNGNYQGKEIPFSTSPVYLKISRAGNDFTASYSTNNSSWTNVLTVNFPANSSLQVGLVLLNEWQDHPISADFDFFELTTSSP